MRRGSRKQLLLFPPRGRVARPKHWAKPGPKQRPERKDFLSHRTRPAHDAQHPVLVTIRCRAGVAALRSQRVLAAIASQVREAIRRGIGINHYSIQDNHLHLVAEARDKERLARGMQLFFSRVAFEVNRVLKRSGRLFRDRHHRQALTTPTQLRRALVYVLFNRRKHLVQKGAKKSAVLRWLDAGSSIGWFEGWSKESAPPAEVVERIRAGPCPPGAPPRTWLGRVGWIRGGGYLRHDEMPRTPEREGAG